MPVFPRWSFRNERREGSTWKGALLVSLVVALSPGCVFFAPTPVPIRTIHSPAVPGARTLIVFLPGRGGAPEDYAREGFQKIAADAGLDADTIAVDAHLGYYRKRTATIRIKEDVIDPAHAAGYTRIVLVGISMGGLGAVLYAKQQPQDIAAIVLIAPFLGDKDVLDEIEAAGGIAKWTPAQPLPESDYQRDVWKWLRGYADPNQSRPPVYLGFGTGDRFLRSHRLLAGMLPPSQVFTAPGGHDWAPWREVYRQILLAGPVPRKH